MLHALLGVAVIVALALPFLSLRLGFSDAGNEPTANTSRRAYDLLAEGFGPGFNGPLVIAVDRTDAIRAETFGTVLTDIAHTPGVATVSPPTTLGAGAHAIRRRA